MRTRVLLPFVLALAIAAQDLPPGALPKIHAGDNTRLPNGKLQRDEILREDYEKSLEDARELARLTAELKADLEKSDRFVLSIPALKKTEEIEKLAKRIRGRMKRF
jgi:hypothetical protein